MTGEPVIVVEDLQKTYADGTAALRGVSFRVGRGEIFGFLGPNGAGKTTAMRILGTLHKASGGRASVLGYDVDRQASQVQRRIGFAMQEVGMDDLATAREMLLLHGRIYGLSKKDARQRADELLATFGLTAHADRRVTRFSGGMQRRLDLAVSLIHTPEVLFLDEPSTGLDPKSRSDLWAVLRRLRKEQGITILMSTHYMDEADALCDRIAIINKGRVAAIDTPSNLKRMVGADMVKLALTDELQPEQWAQMQRVFGVSNVRRQQGEVSIRVRDGAAALMPALRVVTELGIQVRATKVTTPTLEDVFLKYTGASLAAEDDGPSTPDAPQGPRKGARFGKISDEPVEVAA